MQNPSAIAFRRDAALSRATRHGICALGTGLCVVVAILSYRYFFHGYALPLIALNSFKDPFLLVHVGSAATALLVMPLQLIAQLRAQRPDVHRWVGRTYVAACLVGAVAGFMLALGSDGGDVVRVGFSMLAVAWFAATLLGWQAAVRKRFDGHRAWMIRSFALTFAAVTLRLQIPLGLALGLPFLEIYGAIAFLCWIPNLIVAEIYLQYSRFAGASKSFGNA